MDDILQQAARLGPWVHGFWHRGELLGGELPPAPQDLRPEPGSKAHEFVQSFPNARRILELGALEGVDTFQLAQSPDSHVVAIEGREKNLAKARFLRALYRLENIDFMLADIEDLDFLSLGRFDACMCSGVLYHVARPWDLLARIHDVAPVVYIWTHYWVPSRETHNVDGLECKQVVEDYPNPLLRGLVSTVNWLTLGSLLIALEKAGFQRHTVISKREIQDVGTISLTAST